MRKLKDRSFEQLRKAMEFNGHGDNYCVPLSVCAVSGLSAGKVVAYAKRHVDSFELGKGLTIDRARDLLECVYGDNFRISGGEFGPCEFQGKQFRTAVKELCGRGGRFIIITMNSKRGHASAIRDGKLIDHYDPEQRHRVGYVIEVGDVNA